MIHIWGIRITLYLHQSFRAITHGQGGKMVHLYKHDEAYGYEGGADEVLHNDEHTAQAHLALETERTLHHIDRLEASHYHRRNQACHERYHQKQGYGGQNGEEVAKEGYFQIDQLLKPRAHNQCHHASEHKAPCRKHERLQQVATHGLCHAIAQKAARGYLLGTLANEGRSEVDVVEHGRHKEHQCHTHQYPHHDAIAMPEA